VYEEEYGDANIKKQTKQDYIKKESFEDNSERKA